MSHSQVQHSSAAADIACVHGHCDGGRRDTAGCRLRYRTQVLPCPGGRVGAESTPEDVAVVDLQRKRRKSELDNTTWRQQPKLSCTQMREDTGEHWQCERSATPSSGIDRLINLEFRFTFLPQYIRNSPHTGFKTGASGEV